MMFSIQSTSHTASQAPPRGVLSRMSFCRSSRESTIYVYSGDNILSEFKTYSILVNGIGTLTPITLKKNYINSIGTDGILAYDAEEQISPTGTGKTTNRYYYHTNQLGSVIALTNSTGAIMQTYSYDAFGKAYVRNGSGTGITLISFDTYTGSTYSNSRLYTGREYDKEIGMYYLRARYYNANTGKFISRDPIGQNDQVNLYTYVGNSPLKYVDRMGREKKIVGTLRIYSWYDDYLDPLNDHFNPLGFIDGHGWIEITIGDEVTSYGIGNGWKNTKYAISKGSDITKNLEIDRHNKDRNGVISLGININKSQLNTINNYIDQSVKDGYQWGYTSPCTDFASDIWNSVSDISLSDRSLFGINNPYGLSTPDALAQSIAKTMIDKNDYESSGEFNKDTNPYKNIIY